MSLNIKREETHRLARELAELTGESLTVAATVSVRERLDRVRRQRDVSLVDHLLAIGRDCAAHLKEPYRSIMRRCSTMNRGCLDDCRHLRAPGHLAR